MTHVHTALRIVLPIALLAGFASAQGATQFIDDTTTCRVNFTHTDVGDTMAGGGCLFDFDGDGDQDLYLTRRGGGANVLYRNDGGVFADVSVGSGLDFVGLSMGAYAADLDNDGLPEIVLLLAPGLRLFHNDGSGRFSDITASSRVANNHWATAATFGDFDKNGFLDIYVGNYVEDGFFPYFDGGPNRLFRNDGNLKFTDVTFTAGVSGVETFTDGRGFTRTTFACTLSVLFFDYDRDGWIDLLSGNDFGRFVIPNQLFRNNRDGTFTEVGASAGFRIAEFNMGLATADVNSDGIADIYTTNLGDNHLLLNGGQGRFSDAAPAWGATEGRSAGLLLTSWACLFLDADLDTRIDLYVSNGFINTVPEFANDPLAPSRLLYHQGFNYLVAPTTVCPWDRKVSRGAMRGDIDGDGDEDVIQLNNNSTAHVLRNTTVQSSRSITLDLHGTLSNRDGVGAVVKLRTRQHTQVQDHTNGGSYLSGNAAPLVRGLGGDDRVEQLTVTWPSDVVSRVYALPGDRRHEIVEPAVTVEAVGRALPIGSTFIELPLTVRNHASSPEPTRFVVTLVWGDLRAGQQTFHLPVTLGAGARTTLPVYIPFPYAALPLAQQLGIWVNVEAVSRISGKDQIEQPLR